MKRTKSNIVIETGGEGTEESFGIGNLGFILKVLRGKMYSNPIKAICREISSNSRDAHREIGKDDLPIEIHLPNTFDSHIKFKDYGPGIDPQRMSGVFILYGNTTKDSDNVQTGGFGLGAKTPFAYSDQFSIFTITPENRGDKIVNIKRNYIAYIDPSEAGKMRKISEEETDEPCGTELSIYVDGNDWGSFTDAVMEVTAYWDVKPKLSGRSPLPEYKEDSAEPFLQGNGWSMPQFEDQGYYDEDQSLAIVDGIAYPIDRNNMKSLEASEIDLLRHGLRFHFGVGELSLSSNRERLQYDDNTVGLIKEKL
ncbi:MAG TPA: ATP-binding protein, partial [Desulfosporosinus sp.]|nr:ATP-binding protein [Desulfosporosinus sp.]